MAPRKPPAVAKPPDETLARAALEKLRAGQQPTVREAAALRRYQKAVDEAARQEHYRTIPRRQWCKLAGRQRKTVEEQAIRYGAPLEGPTIDLAKLAPWLHDFLAANKQKLAAAGDDLPPIERKRLADAKRAEWALARDLGLWVPRDQMHAGVAIFATQIRRAGELLQRQFGPAAHDVLDQALTSAIHAFQTQFPPDERSDQQ